MNKASPQPLRREGSASSQVFCRNYLRKESLSSRVYIGTPPPSGRLGGAFTPLLSEGSGEAVGGGFLYLYLSLCKTDSYKGICGTCYSSTPKNDCFLNKVAYLCKQKRKSLTNSPTRPPREGRSADCEIAPKSFRS